MKKDSEGIEGWSGFDPSRSPGALYPNEVLSFLPSSSVTVFLLHQ